MKNIFKRRTINNFDPDKPMAWSLTKRRLKKPSIVIIIVSLLVITGLATLWSINKIDQAKIYLMVVVAMQLLVTATYFIIFDNGAANRLRKERFKVEGINSIKQAHTYYYSLKQSGFLRLTINSLITFIYLMLTLSIFVLN